MALKITSFPIITVDNKATEFQEGLCPALSGDVDQLSGASTSAVVSEYGIRKALDDQCDNAVSGINLGSGKGIFSVYDYDPAAEIGTVSLKSLKINNDRFTITQTNNSLKIDYNAQGIRGYVYNSGEYVQGGKYQLNQGFPSLSGFQYIIFNISSSNKDVMIFGGLYSDNVLSYNESSNTWTIPGTLTTLGTYKGWYVGTGTIDKKTYLFYEYNFQRISSYNHITNVHTELVYPLTSVSYRYGVDVYPLTNFKIYWGSGYYSGHYTDMYEFNINTYVNVAKASFNTLTTGGSIGSYASWGIYGYGLGKNTSYQRTTLRYDSSTDSYTLLADSPVEIYRWGAAQGINEKLYLVNPYDYSGYINDGPYGTRDTPQCSVYTIATDTWNFVAQPTNLKGQGALISSNNNMLYYAGGSDSNSINNPVYTTEKYNPVTNVWQIVSNIPSIVSAAGQTSYNY